MGPEARLERACVRLAKKDGWLTVKMYAEPGFPDRMFIDEYGYIAFVEFKSAAGRATKKQRALLTELTKRGISASVVRTAEEFKLALKLKP